MSNGSNILLYAAAGMRRQLFFLLVMLLPKLMLPGNPHPRKHPMYKPYADLIHSYIRLVVWVLSRMRVAVSKSGLEIESEGS